MYCVTDVNQGNNLAGRFNFNHFELVFYFNQFKLVCRNIYFTSSLADLLCKKIDVVSGQ